MENRVAIVTGASSGIGEATARRLQRLGFTVYAAARLSLTDSLKLIGGSRYGRWKIDSFYVYDSPTTSKYDYTKAIPYAGLVWDVLPEFSVFTSYTGIFKPQSSRDINGRLPWISSYTALNRGTTYPSRNSRTSEPTARSSSG